MGGDLPDERDGGIRDHGMSLEYVLEASGLGYWFHDIASDRLDCSAACKAIFGLAPDAEISFFEQFLACIHAEDRPLLKQAVERAVASGDGYEVAYRIGSASGEVRWARSRGRVFRQPDGDGLIAGITFDVTERKRSEGERERLMAELATERARLRTLVDHLPAAVLMADPTGSIVMTNRTLDRLVPRHLPNAPERVLSDVFRGARVFDAEGQPLPDHDRPLARALRGETVSIQDFQYVPDGDGRTGWFRVSSAPIRDDAGAVSGAVMVGFEVDSEKRAEQALRATEGRLRQLFESPVIGILHSHMDGRITSANDTFLEMSGYSRDDLREGRLNWKRMTPPEFHIHDESRVDELLATGTISHFEKEYLRKDGTRVPVLIGSVMLEGSKAEIVTFVLDISERKRAERERESLLQSLERSEERYRLAALATEDVIYDWDLRTERVCVQTMFGQPRAYVNHLQSWADLIHPDDREPMIAGLRALVEKGERRWHAEYRFAKGDGSWLTVVDRGYLAFDADGRPTRLVGAMRDVTARRQQQEFERQLIGIVSHDLRSPLNTITLAAGMLVQSAGLGERSMNNTLRIQRAADRATRMIRDLLDFTRARLGTGIPIERRPVDLGARFRDLIDELRVSHPNRRIDVHVSGELTGLFDADRLAQVLTNLIENGLKYGAPGSPVRVTLQGAANDLSLVVHNDGPPIAPEVLPHIFEPLKRGDAVFDSAHRSVGLGLYIVKHLVEAHGGRVEVCSSSGEGTAFRVQLPRSAALSPA
jgi:PAS domain S-box-containing protein